jgi:predicted transcriptional regulator
MGWVVMILGVAVVVSYLTANPEFAPGALDLAKQLGQAAISLAMQALQLLSKAVGSF